MGSVLRKLRTIYMSIGIHAAPRGTLFYWVHEGLKKIFLAVKVQRARVPKKFSGAVVRATSNRWSVSDVGRVLILKVDHIGDFVTSVDAIKILQSHFSNAQIDLVCLPQVAPLANELGGFEKVIEFDGVRESEYYDGAMKSEEKLRPLLSGKYDLAIDLRHDTDTRHFLNAVDAEVRAGFFGGSLYGLQICLPLMEWDVGFGDVEAQCIPLPASTRTKLLAYAVVDSYWSDEATSASVEETTAVVSEEVRKHQIKVGVSVGAGAETKRWKKEYWVELIRMLGGIVNLSVLFYGGKGDRDATNDIVAAVTDVVCVNRTARVSLEHLYSEFETLDLYIGLDTGLTHLAASTGIPTIDLYSGVANVSVWAARGLNTYSLHLESHCAPCHLRSLDECKYKHGCLDQLTPEMVFKQAAEFLKIEVQDS